MKLLCAFRTQEQYQQLQRFLPHAVIEWSDNLSSEAELQARLAAEHYDLLILDPMVWWSQQASELSRRSGVEVLLFGGDLRDVANHVVRRLSALNQAGEAPEPIRAQEPEPEAEGPVRIIEREKIVEVEKIIEKERIVERQVRVAVPVHSYVSMQSKLCMFLNLTPRAGATFTATSVAASIAARSLHCTLIEHPANRVSLYDHLNVMDLKPDYKPPFYVLNNGSLKKESELLYQGIAMYLNHPGIPNGEVSSEEITEMIYQLRHSPFLLYDVSYQEDKFMGELLPEFDHVFLAIDPDPVLLQRLLPPGEGMTATEEYLILQELIGLDEAGMIELHLVVNKHSSGVDQKLLAQCLPKKPLTYLPAQPAKAMYKAAWEARFVEIDEELNDHLMPILQLLVPENFLAPEPEEERGGGKWFGRLFARK